VLATLTEEGLRVVRKAGEELATEQFGLPGVSDALAQRVTAVLGQVRAKMGDID